MLPAHRVASTAAALMLAAALAACGSDNNSPAAPTPNPTPSVPVPPPVVNAAPRITSMTANPSFGVATLTAFAMTAAATDSDGDALTFDWELGDGSRASGPAVSKTYLTDGAATVTLTVTDGRGGSTTDRRTITVGSLNGGWSGTIGFPGGQSVAATLQLTQVGGVVTG
jgi:PKD repeat protein